jgi:hypothetical protein
MTIGDRFTPVAHSDNITAWSALVQTSVRYAGSSWAG